MGEVNLTEILDETDSVWNKLEKTFGKQNEISY